MLLSYTAGGDIYSQTIAAIQGRGLTADTEDRLNTFILPGVTATGEPNTPNKQFIVLFQQFRF
jgi:hypothetical protein